MGSGSSTPSLPSTSAASHSSFAHYDKTSAQLLTPNNISRSKRGSFIVPKISSKYFTPEMVGDYITKLSPWNEGHGYDGEDFMNHMKFLNYRNQIIEHEVDGSAILSLLKSSSSSSSALNEFFSLLQIDNTQHRHLLHTTFLELSKYLLQSIHLISYEDFVSLDQFPRCPENNSLLVDLMDVDLTNSFIIFVSHCWLRGYPQAPGYADRPHPDDASHHKYFLCKEGIEKIRQNLTVTATSGGISGLKCYIWMDFSCIHQDQNPAGELEHLDDIIKYSDCLFTPIVDENTSLWEYCHTNEGDFYDYKATGWCQGEHSYIQRAWCRIEMFYAANIPLSKHVQTKLPKFRHGLKTALENQHRPHFLYGTRESRLSLNPIQLQPLCKEYSFFEKYHPCRGSVSVASDVSKIKELVDELKPYLPSNFTSSSANFPSPLVTSRKRPVNLIALSRSVRHLTPEKTRGRSPLERGASSPSSPSLSPSPSFSSRTATLPSSPLVVALHKKIITSTPPPLGSPQRPSSSSPLSTHRPTTAVRLSPLAIPSPMRSASSFRTSPEVQPSHIDRKPVSDESSFLLESTSGGTSTDLVNKKGIADDDSFGSSDSDDEDLLSDCGSHSLDQKSEEREAVAKERSSKQLFVTQHTTASSVKSPMDTDTLKLPSSLTQARRTRDINGCVYHGEYKGQDRHGNGQLLYPNGDIFIGLFHQNQIHGRGRYTYGNGDVFVGQWKKGYRHGKGTHTQIVSCLSHDHGEIDNDMGQQTTTVVIEEVYQNGHKIKGKFIFEDCVFIGSLNKEGKREGQKCTVRYSNGDIFEGKYSDDQREGYGRYVYANGDVYEGHYHHHLRHGKGKFRSHLGDLFTGEYKNDKKDCDAGVLASLSALLSLSPLCSLCPLSALLSLSPLPLIISQEHISPPREMSSPVNGEIISSTASSKSNITMARAMWATIALIRSMVVGCMSTPTLSPTQVSIAMGRSMVKGPIASRTDKRSVGCGQTTSSWRTHFLASMVGCP
jgi:hypothetical protein